MTNYPSIGAALILVGALSWPQCVSADALRPGLTCENTAETAFEIIQKHFDFQIGRNIPNILSKGATLTLKHGDDKVLCKIVYDIFDRDKKFVGRGEVPYTAIETHSSSGVDVSVYRSESDMAKSPDRKQGEQLQASTSPPPPSQEVARSAETPLASITLTNGDKYVGETKTGREIANGTYAYAESDEYVWEFRMGNLEKRGSFPSSEFNVGSKEGVGNSVFRIGETKSGSWEDSWFADPQARQAAPQASPQPAPEFISDDGERFVATYNVHGAILRSQNRTVNLGISCDANSSQNAKSIGSWHQSPNGIAVTFPGSKVAIGFSKQNLGIAPCASK
jgi:hypothetical protein